MRKLMTAISFAALALIGTNAGVAQTNVQTADIKYDFPADEIDNDEWSLKHFQTAEIKYDFPTNAQEDDVRFRFPSTYIKKVADTRYDQRSAPTGGDDDPSMRLFSGSKA